MSQEAGDKPMPASEAADARSADRLVLPLPDGTKGVTKRRFAPSAISDFQTCKRRFYYRHVVAAEERERLSPPLAQGSAIHQTLDLFFGLRPRERSKEALAKCLRSIWRRHCPAELFTTIDEEIAYGKAALEMLSAFCEHFDTTVRPVRREGWVEAKLPNGVRVFGKVDRVDPRGEAVDVVDYKTGKLREEDDDLPGLPATQVYVLGTEAEYGLNVARVRFIYLKEERELRCEVEREDVEAWRDELVKTTSEMLAEREFPASPGEACRWCPFSYGCPDAYRVELDDLEVPEDLPF